MSIPQFKAILDRIAVLEAKVAELEASAFAGPPSELHVLAGVDWEPIETAPLVQVGECREVGVVDCAPVKRRGRPRKVTNGQN